jgi:hypothetical protein
MLGRLVAFASLVAANAFAADSSETSLRVIQSAEIAVGLPRMLQLAHADMLFCEDAAAAKEVMPNFAERTTVRASVVQLASGAGLNLAPGLIEGTVDAIEQASINGYLSALQSAALTNESQKRFCDSARIRLEDALEFRKEHGPTAAAELRSLSSAATQIEDFSGRLLSVYVDQKEPLKTVVRKPASWSTVAPLPMQSQKRRRAGIAISPVSRTFSRRNFVPSPTGRTIGCWPPRSTCCSPTRMVTPLA